MYSDDLNIKLNKIGILQQYNVTSVYELPQKDIDFLRWWIQDWSYWEIEHCSNRCLHNKNIFFLEKYVKDCGMTDSFLTWRSVWRVYKGDALPFIYEKMYDFANNHEELLELFNMCLPYGEEVDLHELGKFKYYSNDVITSSDDLFTNGNVNKLKKIILSSIYRQINGYPKIERISKKNTSKPYSTKLINVLDFLANVSMSNIISEGISNYLLRVYGIDLDSDNILTRNKDNKYLNMVLNSLYKILISELFTPNIKKDILVELQNHARLALDFELQRVKITLHDKKTLLGKLKMRQKDVLLHIRKIEGKLSSNTFVFEEIDINNLLAKIKKFQAQLESSKTNTEMREQINAKIAKLQKKLALKQQALDELLALKQQSNMEQLETLKQENNLLIEQIALLEEEIKDYKSK